MRMSLISNRWLLLSIGILNSIIFEAIYGFPLFSMFIFLLVIEVVMLKKLENLFSCSICINLILVVAFYLTLFIITLYPLIIYYLVVELLIVYLHSELFAQNSFA